MGFIGKLYQANAYNAVKYKMSNLTIV